MRPVSRHLTRSAAGPVIGMLNIRHRRPAISDEPRPSPEGEEVPRPVQHYDEAVSESDEKIDVCEAPQQPGQTASELDVSKLRYCAAPSDDSQHPGVAVLERGNGSPFGTGGNYASGIGALLFGNRSDAR